MQRMQSDRQLSERAIGISGTGQSVSFYPLDLTREEESNEEQLPMVKDKAIIRMKMKLL